MGKQLTFVRGAPHARRDPRTNCGGNETGPADRTGAESNRSYHAPRRAPIHANESGAAGAAAVERKPPLFPSLAQLLAGHILNDGEVVLLVLKPSLWFIPFSAMRFAAAVLIVVIAAELWLAESAAQWYAAAGSFIIAARVMVSMLQWMGRLYVLTDMRILRLSGVFTIHIFDCPLRKVASTRATCSFRERMCRLGSIEISPQDETRPHGVWRTIRHPIQVHEQILAAISRAKAGAPPIG